MKGRRKASRLESAVRVKPNLSLVERPFVLHTDSGQLTVATNAQSAGSFTLAGINNLMQWTLGNAAGDYYATFGCAFTLDSFPQSAQYTAVFDQYMIEKVEIKIIPDYTYAAVDSATANACVSGWIHTVIDPDDATTPAASTAGVQALQQYESYELHHAYDQKGLNFSLVPRLAQAAYASGVFGSYSSVAHKWIDSASPAVQHYGFKGLVELYQSSTATPIILWRWSIKALVRFRTAR